MLAQCHHHSVFKSPPDSYFSPDGNHPIFCGSAHFENPRGTGNIVWSLLINKSQLID